MLIDIEPEEELWREVHEKISSAEPRDIVAIQNAIADRIEKMCNGRDFFAARLAMEEAGVNAVRHGNELRIDDDVYLDVSLARIQPGSVNVQDEKELTDRSALSNLIFRYEVKDHGTGFEVESVPDPTAPENLERPCGRGVMLMRAFMDEYHFLRETDGMRVILLRAMRTRENIAKV